MPTTVTVRTSGVEITVHEVAGEGVFIHGVDAPAEQIAALAQALAAWKFGLHPVEDEDEANNQ